MRNVFLRLTFALVSAISSGQANAHSSATESPSVLSTLASRLNPILQRHYPHAKVTIEGNRIAFEYDTRVFLVHSALKTGEWQEAREVEGPNRNGILCAIELREGRYDGAAVLPQTFNEHYFQTTVMQVPSRDGARYLYVPLSFPSGAQAGFQQEFSDLMRSAWDGP
jgi:hypothetical protein